MTMKVGPKGQVVVPKHIRDELGIHPGDAVDVVSENGEVRIRRAARFRDFIGCVSAASGGMRVWEAETTAERAREDEKDRSVGPTRRP